MRKPCPLADAMMPEFTYDSAGLKSELPKRPLGNGQKVGSTISTEIKAKEYNNEPSENLPSELEAPVEKIPENPVEQISEIPVVQTSETPEIENKASLFDGLNFNSSEIFAAEKILKKLFG